jgi:transposase-like protein
MSHKNDNYLARLEQIRWGKYPQCPYCQSTHSRRLKKERRYQCNECFTSYSVTVGTLFHKTHVDLEKWFLAIYLVLNPLERISVRQLAKKIGVNKNTASYMIARIRQAMTQEADLLQRLVEIEFK